MNFAILINFENCTLSFKIVQLWYWKRTAVLRGWYCYFRLHQNTIWCSFEVQKAVTEDTHSQVAAKFLINFSKWNPLSAKFGLRNNLLDAGFRQHWHWHRQLTVWKFKYFSATQNFYVKSIIVDFESRKWLLNPILAYYLEYQK